VEEICQCPWKNCVYTIPESKGGIEADVTVTRLTETSYLVVTPAITRLADQTWMRRNKRDFEVVITDVTAAEGVLAIMGPNSRQFMEAISPNDFSNEQIHLEQLKKLKLEWDWLAFIEYPMLVN